METQPPAERWLAKMSLEQRVGQLLILGFSGQQLRPSVRKTIDYMHPGSVILFKHNVRSLSQVAELNQKLQSYARKSLDLPLFIMVDQEGGPVARIKTHPPLPAALAMGNSNDPNLVQDLGRHMGDLLRTLGFNMNLAPVLDIGDPLRKSFIGNR
ncbi:MAG: glycoside hydrolase family 3 N-terminal domain-containing protein, partial [Bdellovibrionales bacterium]